MKSIDALMSRLRELNVKLWLDGDQLGCPAWRVHVIHRSHAPASTCRQKYPVQHEYDYQHKPGQF